MPLGIPSRDVQMLTWVGAKMRAVGIRPLSTDFDSPGRRFMSRYAGHFLFLGQLRAVVVPDDINIVA
jgi:hypothetical protein